MGGSIDYTAHHLGSKVAAGKIIVCPKCGQRGALREYSVRGRVYREVIHEKEFRSVPCPHYHLDGGMYCVLPVDGEVLPVGIKRE